MAEPGEEFEGTKKTLERMTAKVLENNRNQRKGWTTKNETKNKRRKRRSKNYRDIQAKNRENEILYVKGLFFFPFIVADEAGKDMCVLT